MRLISFDEVDHHFFPKIDHKVGGKADALAYLDLKSKLEFNSCFYHTRRAYLDFNIYKEVKRV